MNQTLHRYDHEKCGRGCVECEIPFDTGRIYVCNVCGERLDEVHTKESAYPHWYDQPTMVEWAENIRIERKQPPEPVNRYHKRHEYRAHGGTGRLYLCGPMHPESEQERFVHWVGGSMKVNSRR